MSTSRTSDSLGTLTPSGSRPSAPVAVAEPAPIPPSDDPDFVWDVFYHRAGLTNEYDGAAKVATLYVEPISSFRLLLVNSKLAGRVCPAHWQTRMLLHPSQRRKTRQMRTRMVHRTFVHRVFIPDPSLCTAEEYYKNDYPDEESSEGDASGGSGTSSYTSRYYFFFLWKQRRLPIYRPLP